MGEGRANLELTGYVTAFIDLLGFSRRLEALDILFEPDASESEILLKLKSSIGHVLDMREWFARVLPEMAKTELRWPGPITSAQALACQKMRSPELKVQYVSDAVILSVRFRHDNPRAVYVGIQRMFQSIAGMSLRMLAKGQLCRGGIEIGTGLALSDTEVIGSALAHAHRIEQKQAKYPRTVVGERLLLLLQDGGKTVGNGGDRMSSQLAASCLSSLTQDEQDGRHFVDFLAPWCTSLMPDEIQIRLVDKILEQLAAARNNPETMRNRRIRSKYRWLERYAKTRIGDA